MLNFTCNSTLEDLRKVPIAGSLNFHQLGLIISAACALVAILLSFFLIWMHALHYTNPYEQRHIIRILFMIPVYAVSSLLSFMFYWHAIYFQVISDCYEAFAIASFFALLCHYVAPNLHEQKEYFRTLRPIKGWVWPLSWWKCCGGMERGPFRTPRSGLTWFNIIWTGIYQYCFIRVAMTITAVVTQYFGRYCSSSDSPVFAHIWVLVIEGLAVTVAMFCVIQFYIQMRHDLSQHRPFLKVLAIKLVIFLSFWQSFGISALTGPTFNVIKATPTLAYPDISVGIPSLLVCIEMASFALLHIFAYPYKPYVGGTKKGGFLGFGAFIDAMNPWDMVKAFARGMRWMFIGVKTRESDPSYKSHHDDMTLEPTVSTAYTGAHGPDGLPIANEFRRSKFGMPIGHAVSGGEEAGLIAHAQPNPSMASPHVQDSPMRPYTPARLRYDAVTGQEIGAEGTAYDPAHPVQIGMAMLYGEDIGTARPATSETNAAHSMLWGERPPQQQQQPQFQNPHNQYQGPYGGQI